MANKNRYDRQTNQLSIYADFCLYFAFVSYHRLYNLALSVNHSVFLRLFIQFLCAIRIRQNVSKTNCWLCNKYISYVL